MCFSSNTYLNNQQNEICLKIKEEPFSFHRKKGKARRRIKRKIPLLIKLVMTDWCVKNKKRTNPIYFTTYKHFTLFLEQKLVSVSLCQKFLIILIFIQKQNTQEKNDFFQHQGSKEQHTETHTQYIHPTLKCNFSF